MILEVKSKKKTFLHLTSNVMTGTKFYENIFYSVVHTNLENHVNETFMRKYLTIVFEFYISY